MTTQHSMRALELLALRCCDLADRVRANKIGFIDAVDMAYSAAVWAGLTDDASGDDAVQKVMAAAFSTISKTDSEAA